MTIKCKYKFKSILWLLALVVTLQISEAAARVTALSPGDIIKITVYGQEDLTTETRISEDGMISFPLVGEVEVGGSSSGEVESKLSSLLSERGIVKNAEVRVFLEKRRQSASNSVTIFGNVLKPGKYEIDGALTLVDLLAIAGGVDEYAADHLTLIRNVGDGPGRKIRVDLDAIKNGELEGLNYPLIGGEVILIPKMDVFYIHGQVRRPGRYRLERSMTVMQALSVGGGVTDRGDKKRIELKRKENSEIVDVDAELTDELQSDDVIYVKDSLF